MNFIAIIVITMMKESEVDRQVKTIRDNPKYQQQLFIFKSVISKLLVKTAREPPYLKEFNTQVRAEMIKFLKKEFPAVSKYHRELMDSIQHHSSIEQILPQAFLIVLTQDTDPISEDIIEELLKKKDQPQALSKIDFEGLKLSKRLMNLIPLDKDQHQYIYDLFLKWLLKIEYNVDLIQRAYSYGMFRESVDSDFLKQMKEGSLPMTVIMRSNIHSFMGRAVDFIIEKCFAKSVDTLSSKISSAVVSFVLCSIFGTAPIAVGGFVISMVDLPFSVNINVGGFILEPLVGRIKKYLNMGNKDVCRYILLEAISETDLANQEILRLINCSAQRSISHEGLKPIISGLQDCIDKILKAKSKASNIRSKDSIDRGPALAMLVREDGYAEVCNFQDAILETENSDDGFVEISLKKGYQLIVEPEISDEEAEPEDNHLDSTPDHTPDHTPDQTGTNVIPIRENPANFEGRNIPIESGDDSDEDSTYRRPNHPEIKQESIKPALFKEDLKHKNPDIDNMEIDKKKELGNSSTTRDSENNSKPVPSELLENSSTFIQPVTTTHTIASHTLIQPTITKSATIISHATSDNQTTTATHQSRDDRRLSRAYGYSDDDA